MPIRNRMRPRALVHNQPTRELISELWWRLCPLYLHTCQVRVTVGDSGLCCCTRVTYFQHKLTPLFFDDADQFGYLEILDLDFGKDSLMHEVGLYERTCLDPQAPINDETATTCLIGVTLATTKSHIVRAILDSLAFRFKALYETIITETKIPLSHIRSVLASWSLTD